MTRERGFSLVEVLLASSIVTTMIVALSGLFVLSMKTNAAAGDQTTCVVLAEERIEKLKHQAYDTLTPGGSIDTCTSPFCDRVDLDGNGRNDFQVAWSIGTASSITSVLTASTVRIKDINVRCTPLRTKENQVGATKVITLQTYRTPVGAE